MLRCLVRALAVAALCLVAFGTQHPAEAANGWDFYRWPWIYGDQWTMTQGQNGATSHKSSNGLFYAIDIDKNTTSQPVYAAETGSASCTLGDASFGNYVRIVQDPTPRCTPT